jgi:class 3 adenylate cyclase
MLSKAESACFAIADISGYTHFMSGVELDHAQDIIADIMDTLVRALRPPFRLAKFEGDAAFVYVVADKVDGSLLQDSIEQAYFAFRKSCATSSRPTAASAKPVAGWRASTSSSSFIKASSSGKRCRAARNSPAGT